MQKNHILRNLIYWLIGAIFLLFWLQQIPTVIQKAMETTFGVYLQKYLKPLNINIPANETFYLFGDIDREIWKPLLDEYKLPSWNLPGHEPALSFGIAAYWFLSPFEKRPEWDPNVSTLQWMKEIFLNLPLEEKPLNCLLLPGELIYFPDKWWHATLNVKTSVFFSTFLSPTNNKINENKGSKKDEF
uniref:JmjC domain-containing protein n=1 Tax=Meloidogyne floridensis TaxID=298350 RepID=A0A915NQK7_9BILA